MSIFVLFIIQATGIATLRYIVSSILLLILLVQLCLGTYHISVQVSVYLAQSSLTSLRSSLNLRNLATNSSSGTISPIF